MQGKGGYSLQNLLTASQAHRFAIIYTAWNRNLTERLLSGAKDCLLQHGVQKTNIAEVECPGAFEIPLTAQWCFQKGFDAVICLGVVIRGDTPHFEYVSSAATQGVLQVGLEFHKPCIFGVLTVNTAAQAEERIGGMHGHKGVEAALTALQMLAIHAALKTDS